jgi:hypothetical protein
MTSHSVLQEFLDKNLHRQFPLGDDMTGRDLTDSFTLPSSFLVDLALCAPPGTDTEAFYIKSVVIRRYSADIEIGYDGDGEELTVGKFTKIPRDQELNSSYQFEPAVQPDADDQIFAIMNGVAIVGSTDALFDTPGSWFFGLDTTAILSTRVTSGVAAINSILIDTQIFTGNIALQEGTGVTLTPSYDTTHGRTVIKISADLGALDDLAIPLTSDAAILANLALIYGVPLTSINGVTPDTAGNFTLQGLDCTEVNDLTSGVSISNPCSLPCCDKSALDTAYDAINSLNLKYSRLEAYYQSIGRNINELQSRMVSLEI